MRILSSRLSMAAALAAAFSLTATPAFARGWGGYGHHRHHRGIDGGDMLAGVLILGGIAAIASAASKNSREKREQDYRYPDGRYPDTRDDGGADYREAPNDRYPEREARSGASRDGEALNQAVDTCLAEIERGNRTVESVDSVRRSGEGWSVEGQVSGARDFACDVGTDGRIRRATVEGRAL